MARVISRRRANIAAAVAAIASKPAPQPEPVGNSWVLENPKPDEYWLIARDEEQGYTKRALLFPTRIEALNWALEFTPED